MAAITTVMAVPVNVVTWLVEVETATAPRATLGVLDTLAAVLAEGIGRGSEGEGKRRVHVAKGGWRGGVTGKRELPWEVECGP